LGERTEGRIEFRGPSATAGYNDNPDATAALFDDGWIDTGDLGYLAGGELHVTGRSKDMIIRAGRNLHPQDLEGPVSEIPGVRKGGVAAFAVRDPHAGTERVVVMAETSERDERTRAELRRRVSALAAEIAGLAPDEVALVPPRSIPKTSSGKVRRAAAADMYRQGGPSRPARMPWQLVRFAWSARVPGVRSLGQAFVRWMYGLYCWAILGVVAGPTLLALAIVPVGAWRRRLVRRAARTALRLSGTRFVAEGPERLPAGGPCVLVCNHCSWLDGPMLTAWLPSGFTFVAGEVLGRQRLVGFLLRRIGTEFVERHDPRQAVSDTAELARAARRQSLVFFPEGGLAPAAGLRPFRMGAFVVAVEAGRAVVPVGIQGTRSMLPPGRNMVRPGSVHVSVGAPILPDGQGWSAAASLQRGAREAVLSLSGEPDVA
jgi:1-acyl-sn-glycerol-3-phosphate acyltransferase